MIVLAVLFALSGWSCLCFTMERHRRVVRALHWQRGTAILLRAAGIVLLVSALGPLAAAAHASGELRADLDADDLLVVVRMLGVAADDPERYLDIALRGLAA